MSDEFKFRHTIYGSGIVAFGLGDLERIKGYTQPVRDKDNAQPEPPKPKTVTLEHPRLAPPGMSGIKRAPDRVLAKPEPAPACTAEKVKLGDRQ